MHHGKQAHALHCLARLRLPHSSEINQEDPLLQLEFLEMQVDGALTLPSHKSGFFAELISWSHLFDPKYRRRTLVGIAMGFWQRETHLCFDFGSRLLVLSLSLRVVWDQCVVVLRSFSCTEYRFYWGFRCPHGLRLHQHCTISCSHPNYIIYR